MKFSKRVSQWATHSNPLSDELVRRRRGGQSVLDLTESNPTKCAFKYLSADILKPLTDVNNLSYEPDPRGLLKAREAICVYYAKKGITLDPGQIFITSSTSEAYSFLFRLLLDAGDEILFPRPSYPLFDYLTGLNDLLPLNYRLVYRNGWGIDPESLENGFRKDPKAVIVLNPNNPTGNFVSPVERQTLNELCQKNDTPIICDEVFLDFKLPRHSETSSFRHPEERSDEACLPPACRQGRDRQGSQDRDSSSPLAPQNDGLIQSFASNNKTLTFTLSGISKILGLPQMKLSWIAVSGPEKLRKEAVDRLEIIADTYLSANTPSQNALPVWLSEYQEKIKNEMLERFLGNRNYLADQLKGLEFAEILKCEGGWYATLKARSGRSDEELALDLLRKHGVLVYPGYFFDFEGEGYLVLSLLVAPGTFKEGVDKLRGR